MRKIKIVCDSSSDILEIKDVDYSFSPMKIITASKEFIDDKNLNVEEMVAFFDRYNGRSLTSCPNVTDWIEAFGDADDIICVTITSALSGSYNSACSAKELYESEYENKRVFVLDTLSAGPEITLIVRKLAELINSGLEFEQICEEIREYSSNTGLIFMLKSLRNFANNGRVSPTVAKIAGVMGICIVGKASEKGTLEPMHKCRGEKKSFEALVKELEINGFSKGRISIGHCVNENGAHQLKEMILVRFPEAEIEIHKFRGLCGFYAEKGGILLGYENK